MNSDLDRQRTELQQWTRRIHELARGSRAPHEPGPRIHEQELVALHHKRDRVLNKLEKIARRHGELTHAREELDQAWVELLDSWHGVVQRFGVRVGRLSGEDRCREHLRAPELSTAVSMGSAGGASTNERTSS